MHTHTHTSKQPGETMSILLAEPYWYGIIHACLQHILFLLHLQSVISQMILYICTCMYVPMYILNNNGSVKDDNQEIWRLHACSYTYVVNIHKLTYSLSLQYVGICKEHCLYT